MTQQPLNLLVVTMTGTAQYLAEDLVTSLAGRCAARLQLAEDSDVALFRSGTPLIVVSSTYGKGEVPAPGQPLFRALQALDEDLGALRYGLVALGDSIYARTFANGGRLWDQALQARGARRVGDPLVLDASAPDDPAAALGAWAQVWLAALPAAALAA